MKTYSVGQQFNNWTVLSFLGKDEKHNQLYSCQCICGTIRTVRKGNLGIAIGCGCVRKTYKVQPKIKQPAKKVQSGNGPVTQQTANVKVINRPAVIKLDRKLEEIRLNRELESQFSLDAYLD